MGMKTLLRALFVSLLFAGPVGAQGRSYFTITTGAAGDTTAVHMADSSAVIRLNGQRPVGLRVKWFATGTSLQTTSMVAFQIRYHRAGVVDSNATSVVEPYARTAQGASATADSSVTTGDRVRPAATSAAQTNEIVVWFNRDGQLWMPRYAKYIPLTAYFATGAFDGVDAISIRWRHLHGPGVGTSWIELVTAR